MSRGAKAHRGPTVIADQESQMGISAACTVYTGKPDAATPSSQECELLLFGRPLESKTVKPAPLT